MFEIDKTYTKNDIYQLLSVPIEKQKGAWDTGYRQYEGNIFIFANIGIPGRTGSDYNNYWEGDLLYWEAKTNSNINQPLIRKMIDSNPDYYIYLFTRTDNSHPFTYEGNVSARSFTDTIPIKIIWSFRNDRYLGDTSNGINFLHEPAELYEGAISKVTINKYERNPLARRLCIDHYGYLCQICGFNFSKVYGKLGENFIEIHHVVPLSQIGVDYMIDPVRDLIPICPNCHAMVHRNTQAMSIDELKLILNTHD